MKVTKGTWISFLVTLCALNFPHQAVATQSNKVDAPTSQSLDSRLSRIAATLKERANQIDDESVAESPTEIARGWLKGRRRSFVNGRRRGFLNRRPRRWGDRRGFYNYYRRY